MDHNHTGDAEVPVPSEGAGTSASVNGWQPPVIRPAGEGLPLSAGERPHAANGKVLFAARSTMNRW